MIWRAPDIWSGSTCYIIGGGPSLPRQFGVPDNLIEDVSTKRELPSAYSEYLKPLHNKHVIGVNNAYQLGTWIDTLFFGDCGWYLVHRTALAKWPGLKVTCCSRFEARTKDESEGIKYLKKSQKRQGISEDRKTVSWNGNSGAASISLARHFGAKRIILLGFDMKMKIHSHWHGSHGNPGSKRREPPFYRHLKGFPVILEDAKKMGIEILNANPDSAITEFPKVNIKDYL